MHDYHVLEQTRMLNKTEDITYTLDKVGRIRLYGMVKYVAVTSSRSMSISWLTL